MNVIQDRTQEIKKELAELNHTLKMSVQKAIRIGELLTEQKEFVGHGLFLSWLDAHFDMGQASAYRFMKLSDYQSKITNLGNLQDAYLQIETIEAQEKQSKEERERQLISEFRKTGKKPGGWDRSMDYRIKKDAEAEAQQKERIKREFEARENRSQERKEKTQPQPPEDADYYYKLGKSVEETLRGAATAIGTKATERETWKEKIRLSDGGKEDAFMDALIDYLETLPNDNRRIEACNNIIKICRNISIDLQKQGVAA